MTDRVVTPQIQVKIKGPPHRFKKGEINNPKGRPRGTRTIATRFMQALKEIEKKGPPCDCKCKTFLQHLIIRSFLDNSILKVVADKVLPDKIEVGGKDGGAIPLMILDNQPFSLPLVVPPRLNLDTSSNGR